MKKKTINSLSDFDREYLPEFCQKYRPESYIEHLNSLRRQQDIVVRFRAALEKVNK